MRNTIPVSYQISSLSFLLVFDFLLNLLNKGTPYSETDHKNDKLVCISLSRLAMHWQNFLAILQQ